MVALASLFFSMHSRLDAINRRTDNDFKMHGGLNIGPVVAGVVGTRKPHYDIWGNTVNVASRMETNSRDGVCLVTEDVHRILKNYFDFDGPHRKNIKGKGEMNTYFMLAKKLTSSLNE